MAIQRVIIEVDLPDHHPLRAGEVIHVPRLAQKFTHGIKEARILEILPVEGSVAEKRTF